MRTRAESAKLAGKIFIIIFLILTWAYTFFDNKTSMEQKIIGAIVNSLIVIMSYIFAIPFLDKFIKQKEEQLKEKSGTSGATRRDPNQK